jgi:hypothetical protein
MFQEEGARGKERATGRRIAKAFHYVTFTKVAIHVDTS